MVLKIGVEIKKTAHAQTEMIKILESMYKI